MLFNGLGRKLRQWEIKHKTTCKNNIRDCKGNYCQRVKAHDGKNKFFKAGCYGLANSCKFPKFYCPATI